MKQEEDEKREENRELANLIDKVVLGFNSVVAKENDLSTILLKGHLFLENFLEELIATLDINIGMAVHKLTFAEKIEKLRSYVEKTTAYLCVDIRNLLPLLSAINQIRNDLAHDYNFSLSEANIDKIGVNLGSKYILNKYTEGRDRTKENLLFCLRTTISDVGRIMYCKICDLKREKEIKEAK